MLASLTVEQLLLFAVLISGTLSMNGVFKKYSNRAQNKLISKRPFLKLLQCLIKLGFQYLIGLFALSCF